MVKTFSRSVVLVIPAMMASAWPAWTALTAYQIWEGLSKFQLLISADLVQFTSPFYRFDLNPNSGTVHMLCRKRPWSFQHEMTSEMHEWNKNSKHASNFFFISVSFLILSLGIWPMRHWPKDGLKQIIHTKTSMNGLMFFYKAIISEKISCCKKIEFMLGFLTGNKYCSSGFLCYNDLLDKWRLIMKKGKIIQI